MKSKLITNNDLNQIHDIQSIQSLIRGHSQQIKSSQLHERTIILQSLVRGYSTHSSSTKESIKKFASLCEMLSAIIKSRFSRLNHERNVCDLIKCQSIIKSNLIQKRSAKMMKLFTRDEHRCTLLQSIHRGSISRNSLLSTKKQLITLQSITRCHLQQLESNRTLNDLICLQSITTGQLAHLHKQDEINHIITIQSIIRGIQSRSQIDQNQILTNASTLICSLARCQFEQSNFEFDLQNIIVMQSLIRGALAEYQTIDDVMGLITFQSISRGFVYQNKHLDMVDQLQFENEMEQLQIIQSIITSHFIQCDKFESTDRITLLQSLIRSKIQIYPIRNDDANMNQVFIKSISNASCSKCNVQDVLTNEIIPALHSIMSNDMKPYGASNHELCYHPIEAIHMICNKQQCASELFMYIDEMACNYIAEQSNTSCGVSFDEWNNIKFRFFVVQSLKRGMLVDFLSNMFGDSENMNQFYKDKSVMMNRDTHEMILENLKRIVNIEF
ncbi:hypothetical protein AKO1_002847 [Acrasis kona]|uniref:RUN domain-containing protein n=1 Tax=Acrasis kona TaxID=1008807 RepID=A0AAW2YIJ5_9EUKA